MSHLPKFKFYLKKNPTTWYRSDNSVVTTTGTATPLKYAPRNWLDGTIKWVRNTRTYGLGRSLTTAYDFLLDGAEILRKVFYTEGVEGVCTFEIWILNDADWTYSFYYSGPIDFSKSLDTSSFFTVNILDNSLESKIKSNENVPYEIDCNVADLPSVRLNGILLYGKYNYAIMDSQLKPNYGSKYIISYNKEGDYPIANESDQTDFEYINVAGRDTIGSSFTSVMFDSLSYLLQANQDIDIYIDLKQRLEVSYLSGSTPGTDTLNISAFVVDKSLVITNIINVWNSSALPVSLSPTTYNVVGSTIYFPVQKGAKVYLIYRIGPSSALYNVKTFGNADLTSSTLENRLVINVKFKLAETFCPAIPYWDFFDKLLKKVAESPTTISYSSMLRSLTNNEDNVAYYNHVTCGDAIRGFETAKIRTTFKECFDDLTFRHCAGLGIDIYGRIVIESAITFFNKDLIIADLGEVKDMNISEAVEYLANQVNVGQENQSYDQLNGRYEYNQTESFKIPISRVTQVKDMVGKYRYDMYGIETYRANLSQKKTTDSKSDNDTFILSTESDTFVHNKLRRPNLSTGSVSGVPDISGAYNIDLSPKRNLLRNKSILAAITHLRNSEKLTFLTTDKNEKLSSKFNSSRPLIIEKDDVLVSSLGIPLFLPIMFEFSCIVNTNLLNLMQLYSRGCFKFKYKGTVFKGFPMDVGVKPAQDDTYEMKLLSTPDNDITKLY